jgi:CMP-N-acetylneuraminic acid synthetase
MEREWSTQLGFLWNESGPLNYDRTIEKWPRTQTLPVIHEVNSAVFLAPVGVYRSENDRIGDNPVLFDSDSMSALDIDWEEDFDRAEALLKAGVAKI